MTRTNRLPAALLVLIALVAAGCGSKSTVREGPITVAGGGDAAPAGGDARQSGGGGGGGIRIAVVTHGQASSPFWAIVRNGVEAAARQMDVLVNYRAPDVYSVARMTEMIDQAVATHPDGLVVSLPEPAMAPAVRRAVKAGIPVVSINSGSDVYAKLGVLAHVGQPEGRAGLKSGQRLAAIGARRVLCLDHQPGNVGLEARCRGVARALEAAGGKSTVVPIDDLDPEVGKMIARAVDVAHADAVIALNSAGGAAAAKAVARRPGKPPITVATFDLGPDVLAAVRDGTIAFAVDQQAYLQGYLPIVFLAERARYGLFPAEGDVVPTGPNFVTKDTAAKAIELAKRSIR